MKHFKEGDRVVVYHISGCGCCNTTVSTLSRFDDILKSALTYASADQSARTFLASPVFDAAQVNLFNTYLTNQNTELQQAMNATEVDALTTELIEASKQF
jgi:hypothetical protein